VAAPQRLHGVAVVGLDRADHAQQRRQQVTGQLVAHRAAEVGHLLGQVAGEVVAGQLLGPERLLAQRHDRLAPPDRVEVGEVAGRQAALGRVEDEREDGHPRSSARRAGTLPRRLQRHGTGTKAASSSQATGAVGSSESSRSMIPP
jgi:hypothetical protein